MPRVFPIGGIHRHSAAHSSRSGTLGVGLSPGPQMIGLGEADYSLLSLACQKGPSHPRRKCLIGIAPLKG